MNANTGMDKETFELARSHALLVCDNAASSFNRRMANFSTALLAPLRAEMEVLSTALAHTKAPACPTGMIEHEYCAGTSTWGAQGGASAVTRLVCHLEYTPGEAETETDPAIPAKMELFAAYHGAVNVLDTLLRAETVICIELEALQEVQA